MKLSECNGYKSLLADIEKDKIQKQRSEKELNEKLDWIIDRCNHYAEKTKIDPCDILNAWEGQRTYWYMNYYQDCKQPLIESDKVRVFDTQKQLLESLENKGFRCPACGGITNDPYECKSGLKVDGKICNWKVYGLFGHIGKGVFIFVKEKVQGQDIFMPIAWEKGQII